MKLRALTEEEMKQHMTVLKDLYLSGERLKMGFKEKLISKAQTKKGLAKVHNDRMEYVRQNKLVPFMNTLYVEDTSIELWDKNVHLEVGDTP